jgi:hypothetical protein
VVLVLLDPGLDGTVGLPDVGLTTLAGHAVHRVPSHPSQAEENWGSSSGVGPQA